MKTTAQMLQTVGSRLSATELPRGMVSTEELFVLHTRQWDKLRVSSQWPLTVQPLCQQMVRLLEGAQRRIKLSSPLFSSDLAATDHLQPSRQAVCEGRNLLRLGGTCKRIAIRTCEKHLSKGKLIPALCW